MKGTKDIKFLKEYKLNVIIEKDNSGFFVICPKIQGCYTQGDTRKEALQNIKEAIRGHFLVSGGHGSMVKQAMKEKRQ